MLMSTYSLLKTFKSVFRFAKTKTNLKRKESHDISRKLEALQEKLRVDTFINGLFMGKRRIEKRQSKWKSSVYKEEQLIPC